jgi:hypothetical protein
VSNDDEDEVKRKRRKRFKEEYEGSDDDLLDLDRIEGPFKQVDEGDGSTLALDFNDVPTPNLNYPADVADVYLNKEDDEVVFLFGQVRPITKKLYTLAAIRYPEYALDRMLERNATFLESLRQAPEIRGPSYYEVEKSAIDEIASNNLYTDRATVEQMAFRGEDGEMNFYFMSPLGFQKFQHQEDASELIRPILSVSLSASVLLGFLEKLYDLEV